MEPAILFLVAIANIALLIWFIITLRSIDRNTERIAEYIRSVAICHPPNEEQARVINRALSIEYVLAKLAAEKTAIRLQDTWPGMPPALQLDNFETADPEMLRFVNENRAEFIQFLLRRQRTDDV